MGHKWGAIVITALFFGATHGMLQQSITATVVGILVGYLAVQSRSLYACMAYHVTHNSLAIGLTALRAEGIQASDWLAYLFKPSPAESELDLTAIVDQAFPYQPVLVGICAVAFVLLIYYFATLPATYSDEERLQKALTRQPSESGAAARNSAKESAAREQA